MQLKKPTAVLFDWDGTLVDSVGLICVSMVHAFEKANITPPDDLVRKLHGPDFIKNHFPESMHDDVKKMYRDRYNKLANDGLKPLFGAEQSLQFLQKHKIKTAVVSNKTANILQVEVNKLGWGHYFLSVVGSGTVEEDKPSPLPALKALQDIGMQPSESVWFVGDTVTDMRTAYNSGCLPVFFGEDDHTSVYYEHCRPKAHFPNHKELVQYLSSLK